MNIRIREVRDITIMDVDGQIDINSSEFIEMAGWLLKNNKLRILCNFESVELVDYSGLSILAIAYKNVTNHGGKMKFYNVALHIKELFRVAQMDSVFYCYNNEEEALKGFDEKIPELESKPLRRRFKRLDININVIFRVTHGNGREGHSYTGKVLNISGAGTFIYTPHMFPIRTKLTLEIFLPKELVPLETEGMVIWIADKTLQSYCYPGMGVQFTHIDIEKQKEIVDFIERNITHRSEI